MKKIKLKSIIALGLAFVIFTTGVVVYNVRSDVKSMPVAKFKSIDDNDRVKINQIANTTGAKVEYLTKLRQQGRDWNEVVQLAKSGDFEDKIDTVDYKALLKKEDKKTVDSIKLITDKVEYSLKEIYSKKQLVQKVEPEVADFDKDSTKDDIEEYYKLYELYENDKLTYLCIKLKKEYKTIENVIDEYLYCLQIEVDLSESLKDKEKFDKDMQEKSVLKNRIDAINMNKIEMKMLDVIKGSSESDSEKKEEPKASSKEQENPKSEINDITIPTPDVKPKNPQEEIMNEIDKIKTRGDF